jgi:hypothetical protein
MKFLPWFDTKLVPQCLQSRQRRQGHSGRSREIQISGHVRSIILVDAGLLCEGASPILCNPGKHTITHMESFDVAAYGNHFTRKLVAQHERKPWPQDGAKLALSELEIDRVQTRSVHFNENIARPRRRCRDIHQLRTFGAAVMLENVCAHESPCSGRGVSALHGGCKSIVPQEKAGKSLKRPRKRSPRTVSAERGEAEASDRETPLRRSRRQSGQQ